MTSNSKTPPPTDGLALVYYPLKRIRKRSPLSMRWRNAGSQRLINKGPIVLLPSQLLPSQYMLIEMIWQLSVSTEQVVGCHNKTQGRNAKKANKKPNIPDHRLSRFRISEAGTERVPPTVFARAPREPIALFVSKIFPDARHPGAWPDERRRLAELVVTWNHMQS